MIWIVLLPNYFCHILEIFLNFAFLQKRLITQHSIVIDATVSLMFMFCGVLETECISSLLSHISIKTQ